MTYQESFKDWESIGVKIIPILSQPDERWSGERGYVQTAFSRAKDILNPSSTVVVLCGRKQMAEVCFSKNYYSHLQLCPYRELYGFSS
ncbi:hypothetical protein ZIOFF_010917 [Zingiber officinale]|uniref:Oxidoreductase FAD/NAD(P)-binding domain-containing protein n=1 Tax=Zingiber officinale TaxID=94328 RepID=A0A8J5HWK4_ZINOF|nr:hypothetical protein ZIOFF_010917 [Zingiber officinale]